MSQSDKITIKPFKFTSMKGFTKEENDYFWNNIKQKSTIINIDSNINKNADNLFEQLGFQLMNVGDYRDGMIKYSHMGTEPSVIFYLDLKIVELPYYSTPSLIKATYLKIQELGWIDN